MAVLLRFNPRPVEAGVEVTRRLGGVSNLKPVLSGGKVLTSSSCTLGPGDRGGGGIGYGTGRNDGEPGM